MLYRLHRSISLKTSIEEAWEFFSNPSNLPFITPPHLDMRITSPPSEQTYEGQIITYRIRPFLGFPLLWVTEITHIRAPHYFVDEQRAGPYRLWHHQHFLKPVSGGVLVEDIVDYLMPLGPLGVIMQRLLVARQLETIFSYRAKALADKFGVL